MFNHRSNWYQKRNSISRQLAQYSSVLNSIVFAGSARAWDRRKSFPALFFRVSDSRARARTHWNGCYICCEPHAKCHATSALSLSHSLPSSALWLLEWQWFSSNSKCNNRISRISRIANTRILRIILARRIYVAQPRTGRNLKIANAYAPVVVCLPELGVQTLTYAR